MLDNEAIEIIKEKYIKNNAKNLILEKVTESTLADLLLVCDSTKHMEECIKWYDDEERPDWNSWVDVEGEGYGWIWLHAQDDESKWHDLLRDSLLEYIRKKNDNLMDREEYVFIVNIDQKIIYHFVERESSQCDTIYSFSDEEIDY